jgi:hypothetical protein
MPSLYQPLLDRLRSQPRRTTTVTLTLAELAALLGASLPPEAWTRAWWLARVPPGEVHPWVEAGWRVTRTALQTIPPTVTFARRAVPAARRASSGR